MLSLNIHCIDAHDRIRPLTRSGLGSSEKLWQSFTVYRLAKEPCTNNLTIEPLWPRRGRPALRGCDDQVIFARLLTEFYKTSDHQRALADAILERFEHMQAQTEEVYETVGIGLMAQ